MPNQDQQIDNPMLKQEIEKKLKDTCLYYYDTNELGEDAFRLLEDEKIEMLTDQITTTILKALEKETQKEYVEGVEQIIEFVPLSTINRLLGGEDDNR